MVSTPFLSVVIPTYNRAESLRVTLTALARQDPVPGGFEVIVVSDGSKDSTWAVLTEWASRELPFALRPIQQENAGPARARNRGIQEAHGEVVVFLDDDIEPLPGCLAAHAYRHLASEKLVVIGPMSPDPERASIEPVWIAWEHAMLQKQYDSWKQGRWSSDACGPHNFYTGNASVRRAYLLAVGGFDEGFTRQEDVELATRMERVCGVYFRFDPTPDALHRPLRSFESWLRVPYAYGRLDVVRAQRGDAAWELVRQSHYSRQLATRALARLTLPLPVLGKAVRAVLKAVAQAAYALPQRQAKQGGLAALSVIYNLHYLEGVRDELGSWSALNKVFRASNTPQVPPQQGDIEERAA